MKQLNIKKIVKGGGKKLLKNGSYSVGLTLIVVAAAIVINLIVDEIPSQYTQFDFSEQKLYTISDETKQYLESLQDDITIYYIAQEEYEDTTVAKLLERYDDYSSHIKVEQKDPVVNPGFTSTYTDDQVSENSVIVVSDERSKIVDYNSMYETEVDYTTYSTNATGFDGEGQITSAIEYVLTENLPVMYTLEGHGEAEIPSNIGSLIEKENIETKTLNLITEGEIPEDADALMICSPTSDISENEADIIIEYLENGGKTIVFTDYTENELTNVQKVLNNYGIQTMDGIVLEGNSQYYAYQMPYYLVPDIESTEITSDLVDDGYYVLMPAASGIEILDEKRDSISFTPLLTTSNDSFTKVDVQNMDTYEKVSGDIDGPFHIGMYVSEQLDEKLTELVYFSSSSILNDTVDQMVSGGNSKLVIRTISTLCKQSEETTSLSVPVKSLSVDYLTLTAYDVSFWMIVTIGLIPGLCIIIGLRVWLKRRKR